MVVGRDIQGNLTNRSRFTPVHGQGDQAWSVMKRSAAVLCGTGALCYHHDTVNVCDNPTNIYNTLYSKATIEVLHSCFYCLFAPNTR